MRLATRFWVSIFFLALTACGSGSGAGNSENGVIPAAQMDALKKAQSVEDSMKAAEEQRRQDMENEGY